MIVSELISELKNVCPDFDAVVEDVNSDHAEITCVRESDGEVILDAIVD